MSWLLYTYLAQFGICVLSEMPTSYFRAKVLKNSTFWDSSYNCGSDESIFILQMLQYSQLCECDVFFHVQQNCNRLSIFFGDMCLLYGLWPAVVHIHRECIRSTMRKYATHGLDLSRSDLAENMGEEVGRSLAAGYKGQLQ